MINATLRSQSHSNPPPIAAEIGTALKVFSVVLVGVVALLHASQAKAHDAPQGWSYPFACCSGIDCREVSSEAISERPEGYMIAGSGELVGYTDKRIKDSPDGEFHWCSVGGKADSKTICLFVPPRAF